MRPSAGLSTRHKGRRNVVDWAAIIAHLDSPLNASSGRCRKRQAEKIEARLPKGGKETYGEAAVGSKRGPTADDRSAAHLGTTTHQVKKARKKLRDR